MKNPFRFFVELTHQDAWIPIWVMFLMMVHVTSAGFWHQPAARLILAQILMGAMLMMGRFSRFGFEKFLG